LKRRKPKGEGNFENQSRKQDVVTLFRGECNASHPACALRNIGTESENPPDVWQSTWTSHVPGSEVLLNLDGSE